MAPWKFDDHLQFKELKNKFDVVILNEDDIWKWLDIDLKLKLFQLVLDVGK